MTNQPLDFDFDGATDAPNGTGSGLRWLTSVLEGVLAVIIVVGITYGLVEVAKLRDHVVAPSGPPPHNIIEFSPHLARRPAGVELSPSAMIEEELKNHADGTPLIYDYNYGREVMKEWRARSMSGTKDTPTDARCVWRFRAPAASYHIEVTARSERAGAELTVVVSSPSDESQKIGMTLPNRLEKSVAKNVATLKESGEYELALAIPAGVEIHQVRLVPVDK